MEKEGGGGGGGGGGCTLEGKPLVLKSLKEIDIKFDSLLSKRRHLALLFWDRAPPTKSESLSHGGKSATPATDCSTWFVSLRRRKTVF